MRRYQRPCNGCAAGAPVAETAAQAAWRQAGEQLLGKVRSEAAGLGRRDRKRVERDARRCIAAGKPLRTIDVLKAAGVTASTEAREAAADAAEAEALLGVSEVTIAVRVANCPAHGHRVLDHTMATART